jgi:3-deoxy-D-manno-octulosonate 8-phosphate phosphatase (KDO 8-P phosphatase)
VVINIVNTVILDLDGTLTDGKFYIKGASTTVSFSAKDGYLIRILTKKGFRIVVMTASRANLTKKRLLSLGLKKENLIFNISDKKKKLLELINKLDLNSEEILYIGDDLNDIDAMKVCKYKACPNDAVKEVKMISDYISTQNGGNGAVREILEHYSELISLKNTNKAKI